MELIIIFPKTCHDVEKYPISISGQSQILGKPWKAIAKPKETEGKLRKTMKNPWKSASPKQPSEHLPIGTRPLLPRRARPRPSKPPCSWCRHLRPWCPPAWEYWELGPKFMATSMGNHGNIWQNHETSKKFGVKIVKYLCFTQKPCERCLRPQQHLTHYTQMPKIGVSPGHDASCQVSLSFFPFSTAFEVVRSDPLSVKDLSQS